MPCFLLSFDSLKCVLFSILINSSLTDTSTEHILPASFARDFFCSNHSSSSPSYAFDSTTTTKKTALREQQYSASTFRPFWDFLPHRTAYLTGGGMDADGMHAITFPDGALIISDAQLTRMAAALQIKATMLPELYNELRQRTPARRNLRNMRFFLDDLQKFLGVKVQPCAWNMMFNRR